MKIAMFVEAFPVWTETFILNQIVGLIDRECDVDIYAVSRRTLTSKNSLIDKYNLIDRTYYLDDLPTSLIRRLLAAIKLLLTDFRWAKLKTWRLMIRIIKYKRVNQQWNTLTTLSISLTTLEKKDYDILHCQFGNLGPKVLFLKEIGALNGKLITSFRGHDATQQRFISNLSYSKLFIEGDLFLPVSENLAERLISMGCDKNKIRVLHSGIDCNKFTFKERIPQKNKPIRILSIARFVEMKGLEYGIRAIAKLVNSGHKVNYTIIGDGVLRNELENIVNELGIDDLVSLPGWKTHEETIGILQDSHLLIAPSVTVSNSMSNIRNGETEGIPNSVKEAMATGIPVISTLHGGIPELVEEGKSGFLVTERNVDALAERIVYLIDNPNVWAQMGMRGRMRIEHEYEIEKLNDLLLDYYDSLLT